MLIQELLMLKEEMMEPGERAVAAFQRRIEGKAFVLVNQSIIHGARGNGVSILSGAVKTFPTLKAMASFLARDKDGDESRIVSYHKMSAADKKALNWPEGHDEEDGDLFTKLALKLDPKVFMNLDVVKATHDNGDIDGDNYDWLVCVMDGKPRDWLEEIEDLIYDSAE